MNRRTHNRQPVERNAAALDCKLHFERAPESTRRIACPDRPHQDTRLRTVSADSAIPPVTYYVTGSPSGRRGFGRSADVDDLHSCCGYEPERQSTSRSRALRWEGAEKLLAERRIPW